MMKAFLTLAALFLAAQAATAQPKSAPIKPAPSFLRAQEKNIVDERGETVVLRGVNLGGWLVEEMWMTPFQTKAPDGSGLPEIKDHVTLWRTIETRFGAEQTAKLKASWRDAWINESDFARIQANGFNCVRLPFLYDLLDEPGGVAVLDRALMWARAHELYVVLDLHGAPGRQSNDHHTGKEGVNALFSDPKMVAQTEQVWARVAAHYKDNPTVAGYDLLNEPMGAPENGTLYLVMNRLYNAVRAVDARHLIFVEDGYKSMHEMPRPQMAGWENVVLSVHSYRFNAKTPEDQQAHGRDLAGSIEGAQNARNAPYYLGEFNLEPHGTPDIMREFTERLTSHGWSWTMWTYKVAGANGGRSLWGWYYPDKPLQPLDPFRDSFEDLTRKMSQVRTENLTEYTELSAALRAK